FVWLTDGAAKQAYDVELRGDPAEEPVGPAVAVEEAPGLAWLHTASDELVPVEEDDGPANGNQAEVALPTDGSVQALIATKLAQLALDATPPDIVIPDGLPPGPSPPPPSAETLDPAAADAGAA